MIRYMATTCLTLPQWMTRVGRRGMPLTLMPAPAAEALGFWFKTQVYNFYENHVFSPNFFTTTQFIFRPRQIHREGAQIDPAGQWAAKAGY